MKSKYNSKNKDKSSSRRKRDVINAVTLCDLIIKKYKINFL